MINIDGYNYTIEHFSVHSESPNGVIKYLQNKAAQTESIFIEF